MKIKILFLVLVLFCVRALTDHPTNSKSIQFYSEELLRTRHSIKEPGYTSIEILKERLTELGTHPRNPKVVAAHLGEKGGYGVEFLLRENGLCDRRWQKAGYADIPDMLVNQESYASSFNQSNPSVCMFPDRSFITVWEDERNGDIDVFAQKCTFDGNPIGLNFEVGEEDFPKDQYLPCVSIVDDTSFVVVWIDEEDFDIYGKKFTKDLSPIGETFQIDDSPIPYTTWSPALSSGLDGKFVVVWVDTRSGNNIYARRFDALGNPLGESFEVNDDEGNKLHTSPEVAIGLSGNFVIVWEDFRNTNADIYAQRFDLSGSELGENILVNLDSLNEDQYTPSVSMGPNDRFMVAWVDLRGGDEAIFARSFSFGYPLGDTVLFSISPDTSAVIQESPQIVADTLGRFTIGWTEYSLSAPVTYAQRFDSLGQTQGERIRISDLQSTGERHNPSLSASPSGSFVVTWMDKQAGNYDIYAQTVTSYGFLHGTNLFLNDDEMGANQNLPRIATRSDGGFVVVWEDWRGGNSDIFMRRFDQNAQALGDDYMVNDSIGRIHHGNPDVACDLSENFVVVWEDARENFLDIYAQLFDPSGNPGGENFKVNCWGMTNNSTPCCDVSPEGNFVVVWSSTVGNTNHIYGRLLSSGGEPLDTCFKINDDTLSVNHLSPAVAMDSSEGFVVAWQDRREGQDRIYLQRFASDGTKIGMNFPVYSNRPNLVQYNVDLDLNQRGDFVVTWTEPYLSSTMIFAQRYDSFCVPIDTNMMVVDDPSAAPENPQVKLTDDGYVVVEWTDHRAEGSDIYFQTFMNGTPQDPNQRVNSDPGNALQDFPAIDVWNSYLYSVWRDNRIPGWGFSIFFNRINYTETAVEDHQDKESLPANFVLYQNYPNPFNPVTRIQYTVGSRQTKAADGSFIPITLKIYNVLGQLVRTLVDEEKLAGVYQIIWDGRDEKRMELSSGIYFYQLKVRDETVTKKMVLLK